MGTTGAEGGTPSGAAADDGSSLVMLGTRPDAVTYLNGAIYLVALYNRALPSALAREWTLNPWQIYEPNPHRIYLPAAAGGGTDVLATTGTELWSGLGAKVSAGINVAATTGVETWNGLAASINARVSITAGTGVETWNGLAANVAAASGIIATTGVETWNGLAANVSIGGALQIQATTGTELWGGLSATVTAGGVVTARANRVFRPAGKKVIYQRH